MAVDGGGVLAWAPACQTLSLNLLHSLSKLLPAKLHSNPGGPASLVGRPGSPEGLTHSRRITTCGFSFPIFQIGSTSWTESRGRLKSRTPLWGKATEMNWVHISSGKGYTQGLGPSRRQEKSLQPVWVVDAACQVLGERIYLLPGIFHPPIFPLSHLAFY